MIYKGITGVPDFEAYEYTKKNTKYCICIPVINEGGRIQKELERAQKYKIDKKCDIILCDGGSTDGSTDEALLHALGVNTLLVKKGSGKQGAQLRMGMWWALKRGYSGIITIDGNNKDSIEDIPRFIEKLEQGYDFVQGSRFIKGGKAENTPPVRYLSVRCLHAPVISMTAGEKFTDTTNAYRAYSKKYLEDSHVNPFRDIFSTYELLAYLSVRASQLNMKTCEIPVARIYPKGEKAPTKISFFKGNANLLKILFKNYCNAYAPKPEIPKKTNKKKLLTAAILTSACILSLFLNFYCNTWYTSDSKSFENWQQDSESLVIGRMQLTEAYGADMFAGLLACTDYSNQKESYLNGETYNLDANNVYTRQAGLQGRFFAWINTVLPVSREASLNFCYGVNSLLLAAAITLLLYWVYREFGMAAASFGWLAAIMTKWLTISGRNLYWCIWTLLLPMLCVLFLLKWEQKSGRRHNIILFLSVALTFFLRSACGYEFISTVMISAELPLVYYSVKNRAKFIQYLKRAFLIGIAAVTGFLSAVAAHLSLSTKYLGSFNKAWLDFTANITSRTGMGSDEVNWLFSKSNDVPADEIINQYLYSGEPILFGWHMGALITLFLVCSSLCFLNGRFSPSITQNRRKLTAFSGMLGIAFFAPVSWFILAKGHSYLHTHINYILWCLPFLLIGFCFAGAVCSMLIKDLWKAAAKNKKQKAAVLSVCICVAVLFIGFNQIHILKNTSDISAAKANINPSYSDASVEIYCYEQKLYYIVDDAFNVSPSIYLRVVPTDVNDLIEGERAGGFNSLDFHFEENEIEVPNRYGKRVAKVYLPNYYQVQFIKTGQKDGTNVLWEACFT